MARALEIDLQDKPRALEDAIRYINPKQTPLVSLLPVGKNPQSMKLESNIKAYKRGDRTPIADATAVTTLNSNLGDTIIHCAQFFRHAVGVGKLAQLVRTATVPAGQQMAEQIDDGLFTVKQLLEEQFSSDDDLLDESDGDAAYRARGIFSYASPTAQAKYPVKAAYRPDAAQFVEGDLDAGEFTEKTLKAMIAAQFKKTDGMAVELEAICGMDMQQVFDDFTSNQTTDAGKTVIARYDREDPGHWVNTVNSLSLSGAEVNLHTSTHLLRAAASGGAATTATHKSMIGFDRKVVNVRYLQSPGAEDIDAQGAGKSADLTAVAMMVVENPTSLIAFKHVPTVP